LEPWAPEHNGISMTGCFAATIGDDAIWVNTTPLLANNPASALPCHNRLAG
jgi:hypothetical protein